MGMLYPPSVFYPLIRVLSPHPCFIPPSVLYPPIRVLSSHPCFIPSSVFYPLIRVLFPHPCFIPTLQKEYTKTTRKVKVLSLPETIKEKSTFRTKAVRRELVTTNSRRRAFAQNVDFSFIASGSERTFTFRVSLNTLPTLAALVLHTKSRLYVHKP